MKLVINLEKKYFFSLLAFSLIVLGVVGVVAYNSGGSGGNPRAFGHSVDEIDWSQTVSALNANQLCLGGKCIASWTDVGGSASNGGAGGSVITSLGVNKLIEGKGIRLSPVIGTGNVTINATSLWEISGNKMYYNNGNVGIGTSSPSQRFEVVGNTNITGNLSLVGNINVAGKIVGSGGIPLYKVTYAHCDISVGAVMASSTCKSLGYFTFVSGASVYRYWNCGNMNGYSSPSDCPNTLI
ncbi:MAG TPA: hypothetical protein VI544_02160 [Candidatus Nanoarchaeia archaeon]|nr:hypothetical protein [Candidatus Nanoarchaeia archaeon]